MKEGEGIEADEVVQVAAVMVAAAAEGRRAAGMPRTLSN
jgi:hypothetical protein